MNKSAFLFSILLVVSLSNSQVKVSINSGDPVYPFPQFLPYKNATAIYDNLGTKPGVGVTHAEMEQTIRDGYQIMMNRAVKTGGGVGGKEYIQYLSSPQCSEGDGYGLLGAAAMADKETFDGMWLYIHDFTMNKVKRYSDCKDASPGYAYSRLPGWNGAGANSATDGDVDIGLALLIAYLQWGEFMGIKDACGEEISYKKELIEFLKGLTDTLPYAASNNSTLVCGDIGLDGYIKGGDSWNELTTWASDVSRSGFTKPPQHHTAEKQHIDYAAPAYFRAFADFLSKEDSAKYAWNIKQFRRGEASSDWLMGKMLDDPKMIPFAGWVELSADNVPTFTNFSDGEDFRCAWRTILNEVWHGNPSYTWDPVTHQIKNGVKNSFEMDIGKRYARFLWDQRQEPWGNACTPNVGGDKTIGYWGPEILKYYYTPDGKPLGTFALNWVPGTGSPSAIVSQHHNLMAELYRCLEVKWDAAPQGDDRYLGSVPQYFHGWFRMLGLLVLTGNYQAPSEIKPTANMKVYLAINKTFAFEGDSVTYTIDYRNYGSLDAKDVVITDTLHKDFVFISSTGGGIYNPGSHTVTWSVASVPGVKSSRDLSTTKGQVKLTVKVGVASQDQYRNKVSITCSNGSGWTSNEFPNNITPVMERNYLDIAKRALVIEKEVSNTFVNPGSELEVSVNFENTSKAGWINGGRPGVHFSYSAAPLAGGKGPSNKMRFRLFHDANEAYIDYGNYRVSYFLFDAGMTCYKNATDCPNGWAVTKQIFEGVKADSTLVLHQMITPGFDDRGLWNQKIVLQFSDVNDPKRPAKLTAINYHLDWYRGVPGMIHRGGLDPLRLVWDIHTGTYTPVDWNDDWSWSENAVDADDESRGFPVTNDWTDPDNPNLKVTTYNPKECSSTNKTVDNILVEEWDGYTWRRVAGNGPLPGRDVENVIIRDTIPSGFVFIRFEGSPPFGINPVIKGNVITWTISKLQVKEKGSIKYIMKADGACPMQNKTVLTRAWIAADKESAIYDSVEIKVTCDPVPPPPPKPTTMYKTADRKAYQVNDTVKYTIAYKQTHGTIITDASDSEKWIDVEGTGKLTIKDGEIQYDKANAVMVYKYSYGTNGTIGGTIAPTTYSEFSLVVRNSGSKYIELLFKQDWGDMALTFLNDGKQVGSVQRFSYTGFPKPFNFKIELADDTIRFWAGDTASPLPNVSQTGFTIRAGNAGVKTGKDLGAKVSGWNSHLDVGYNISVTDKIPDGIKFVDGDGAISTGAFAGTKVPVTNTNGLLQWNVISGDSYLDFGDSVTLVWSGICESCQDTIVNTAYADVQGHPKYSIGAQAKSGCIAKPGAPDHVDIILDTVSIDLRNDSEVDTIFIDAGSKSAELFAVIRDANGNFLEKFSLGTWITGNPNIVTASVNPLASWGGIITKTGAGTTVVVATRAGLKSDSVVVVAEETPPWPVISSAIMKDKNGDLIPDELQITLTEAFSGNQSIVNAVISYKGQDYNILSAGMVATGKLLIIPLNTLTQKDPTPSGTVTLNMLISNESKNSSKKFTDGVGPAVTSTLLSEGLNGTSDTLIIGFSETVRTSSLNGNSLQLIRRLNGDTVILAVAVLPGPDIDSTVKVIVAGSTYRPLEGDFLRILPGEKGGTVSDYVGNLAHLLNSAVEIKAKPSQISTAWYVDETGDGVVDAVYLKFHRAVDYSDIQVSLSWSGVKKLDNVAADCFEYQNDTYTLRVNLPDSFKTNAGIRTSVNMFAVVRFKSEPLEVRNSSVSDSAAPVIDNASITPGESFGDINTPDTLVVTFSEEVTVAAGKNPFRFLRIPGTHYLISDLRMLRADGPKVTFTFTTVTGVEYPDDGDSIWINKDETVQDKYGNWQKYESNRRVSLVVKTPQIRWAVKAGPNPFNPDTGIGIYLTVYPAGKYKIKPVANKLIIKIYDAIGNMIYENSKFEDTPQGYQILWNGINKNNRKVGKGTYLAIIIITDNNGTSILKQIVGIKK
ncbi:MAG: DUF11 domain-containing protein [Fibrobacter sp.]|nr:DUF11 domain-containing protein [Fibrobacter sp.]